MNPCPRRYPREHLHVYPAKILRSQTLHRHTAGSRASAKSIHKPGAVAPPTCQPAVHVSGASRRHFGTSRSIKPRELDLRDLRLFCLVRFLTRPTNHPRHAARASNDESKPVRPRLCLNKYRKLRSYANNLEHFAFLFGSVAS